MTTSYPIVYKKCLSNFTNSSFVIFLSKILSTKNYTNPTIGKSSYILYDTKRLVASKMVTDYDVNTWHEWCKYLSK